MSGSITPISNNMQNPIAEPENIRSESVSKAPSNMDLEAMKKFNDIAKQLQMDTQEFIDNISDLKAKIAFFLRQQRSVDEQQNINNKLRHFETVKDAFNAKLEGIEKKTEGMLASAGLSIVGGIISGAGAGFTRSARVGEFSAQLGRGTSDSLSGIGNAAQANLNKEAEMDSLSGDIIQANGDMYFKDMTHSFDRVMSQLNDLRNILQSLTDADVEQMKAASNWK